MTTGKEGITMKELRCLFLSTILAVLCFGAYSIDAYASAKKGCSQGIMGNGTNGIYIDINDEPFISFPSYYEGTNYAYKVGGCAWFASARAKQITDVDISNVWSGSTWWNQKYEEFGFERGDEIRPHSLACYGNHVVVVEAVEGDIATVSESGYPSDGAHGYCVIQEFDISTLESDHNNSGHFYGYVYLNESLSEVDMQSRK